MRDGALVKRQLPEGRWIYGHYNDGSNRGGKPYVKVLDDQGWYIDYPVSHFRCFEDEDVGKWREVFECDGDPMWLREKVLEIFEGADIYVNDVNCVEGKSEEIDELYVKHHDRTRVFAEVFKAIFDYAKRHRIEVVRVDTLVNATVEQPKQKES